MPEDFSRPRFSPGIWKRIEGLLESETDLKHDSDIEDRSKKLLEVVQEGVKHE